MIEESLELTDVKSILDTLGVKAESEEPNFYRIKAFWRGGSNPTAARVNKKTGTVVDFVNNESFSIKRFAEKLGRGDLDFSTFFRELAVKRIEEGEPLDVVKVYEKDCLLRLLPNYTYWLNRGISEETLKTYRGGIANSGKLYQRYVFPVYDRGESIVGFGGRDTTGKRTDKKWKLIGRQHNFTYPCHLAEGAIREKGFVVLVEGIGCSLSLHEANIKNNLVTFGLNLSGGLLTYLMSFDNLKVVIALNNEESERGLNAAQKMKIKLTKFINEDNIIIHLPKSKDFNDMLIIEGKESFKIWEDEAKNKLNLQG